MQSSIVHYVDVHLVNSFCLNNSGGNPAGVVLDAPDMSDEQKTAIAKNIGFSETAFVYTGNDTDFKVEFFTPEGEVDFCGHATLAVFFTLSSLNRLKQGSYTQKTKAGVLNVTINSDNIVMSQTLPTYRQAPSIEDIALSLGIKSNVIIKTGLPIEIISTGLPDIIVPVQSGQLDKLQPNFDAISVLSREFNTIGFHVFELSNEPSITAHCRNFAPLYGINEESATGSASGALGCYLVKHVFPNETHFVLEQGREMKSSSRIEVMIEKQHQKIQCVRVGGQATLIGVKKISFLQE
ncbi:PhzF family phenazine biosynthesis protein [Proteus myxofaciens]|uniref:Phenazine biosynthesis protein n=1 Tax=Proteus myxofaciens ATCC 19692 TaxID=1354337 RepID=A0A198GQH9_9GAMM|nr:PhzF family phenazine biosynthesis protein [Proteus myxofaciens]OAT39125.1 phenazine biosynthesis protein [Proteus myxofaciens ATCC 19692]